MIIFYSLYFHMEIININGIFHQIEKWLNKNMNQSINNKRALRNVRIQ